MKHTNVDVIIVSTNQKDLLKKAIKTLLLSVKKIRINIVVIDNNSKDNTYAYIKKKYPFITLIRNSQTKGFAYNCNLGINHSRNKYILLLNPDTETLPGAIDSLFYFLEKNKNVGICGPKLIFPSGKLQMSCRRFPNWKTGFVRRSPFRYFFLDSKINKFHLGYDLDHSISQPVDWLLGACLLIRREIIHDVGLLDDKYFLYVDDIDYCFRTWEKGWEVWYVPISVVVHHHTALSDKKIISLPSWHHLRSMWHFYWKNIILQKLSIFGNRPWH